MSMDNPIARTAFSEAYPRRFARRVAKTMLRKSFPKEKPFGMIADPALALFDAICALSDRPAKRFRAASSPVIQDQSCRPRPRCQQDPEKGQNHGIHVHIKHNPK